MKSKSTVDPLSTFEFAGERQGTKLTFWQLLPQLFQSGRSAGTLLYWLALAMNLTVNTSHSWCNGED